MFLLNLKRFFKSPALVIGSILYIVLLYLLQPFHAPKTIEAVSNNTLMTLSFSFLYFLIISYEFFYQTRAQKLDEIVRNSKMGWLREKSYGVLLFLGFDAILYVIYLVVSIWGTNYVLGTFNIEWTKMLVKAFFLYHFLLYFFAILLGLLISMISSRLKAFGTLAAVFALFSRILLPIIMQIVARSEKWTHILDIFGIMNRSYGAFCDLFYNYSTESVNLQRILFWILFSISLLFLFRAREKKIWITGVCFGLTLITFALYIQPSGERYISGNWGAYAADNQYYNLLFASKSGIGYGTADEYEGIGRSYKEASFKILKYAGELSAKRELNASIDVEVDRKDLCEYIFTLYHGYRLSQVTDEKGNSIPFEQDVDHVRLNTQNCQPLEKIHFEYAGYSREYVTTSQAVLLGGNFPYLPQPGWLPYKGEPKNGALHTDEYNLKGLCYPVEYDITFPTEATMYTNLTESEKAHFVGKSEGATFISSKFMGETKLPNATLYYPVLSAAYWDKNREKTKQDFAHAIEQFPALAATKNLKIFEVSSMQMAVPMWYVAGDHLIASQSDLEFTYPFYEKYGFTPNNLQMEEDTKQ